MSQIISPENYVLKLGKYKNMRAIDVSEIYQVDKNGDDKPVGLQYLQWLIKQDWFKHKDIIEQIIKTAESGISDVEEKVEEVKKEEKQKKDKKEKKDKKPKKTKEPIVKPIPDSRIVNFD